MASVPDWTPDGYEFERDEATARSFVRRITDSLRRLVNRPEPAPPAPKSLVYALCEEYRHFDLWTAYHAFRLDPHARTWRRLRNRNVPWQRELTVGGLVNRLYPWHGKRTPDPNTVGLALVTAPSAAAIPSRKKR